MRQKGQDFDALTVNASPIQLVAESGQDFFYSTLTDNCKNKNSLTIIQPPQEQDKMLVEELVAEEGVDIFSYSIAELEDGRKIAIASPATMIGAKAVDLGGRKKAAERKIARGGELSDHGKKKIEILTQANLIREFCQAE